MRNLFRLILFLTISLFLFSNLQTADAATFNKIIYGALNEAAKAIRSTSDGGAIVAGSLDTSAYIVKLSATGTVEWQKAYSQGSTEFANDIRQTSDGGYIFAGQSNNDAWIVKLASDGSTTWQKSLGTTGSDAANSIQQTADGGYIFTGYIDNVSYPDLWVVKLDSVGALQWQKSYGNSTGLEYGNSIQQTADGGYIVAGNYDTSFYSLTPWLIKLNSDGTIAWQNSYAAIAPPYSAVSGVFNTVQQTSDSGYIASGSNGTDAWFVKFDTTGNILWEHSFNYLGSNDNSYSIIEAANGTFTAASTGKLLNISADGATLNWEYDYAYRNGNIIYSVSQSSDGGFFAAGIGGTGGIQNDLWILKTDAAGAVAGWTKASTGGSYTTTGGGITTISTAIVDTATVATANNTASSPVSYATLTVTKSGTGYGLITDNQLVSQRPTIDCGNICSASYPAGTVIDLTSTSFGASSFDGWSGAGCSTGVCSVALNTDITITANFTNNGDVKLLDEKFNSATLTTGWSIITNTGTDWTLFNSATLPDGLNIVRGGGGYISGDGLSSSELYSPVLDLSAYPSATLVFKATGGGGVATVELSSDGGATFTPVITRDGFNTTPVDFTTGSATVTVDISSIAGSANAMLRFVYSGGDSANLDIDDVQIYATTPLPLIDTLENPAGLTFTTGGDANWFGVGKAGAVNSNAAKAGTILDNQTTWMETTVTGPATLSFDWSVSSELDYDFLTFYLDGVSQFAISGEVAFETKSVAIPAGSHTLRWEYSKDSSASNGADTGWVDNITLCAGVVTIDTTDISAPFAGSNGNAINITTACNWSAVSNVPWIIFNSSTSGTGNGSVNFDILPTADLVGSIDIGGNKVIVRRSGSDGGLDATFTPNPSTFNFGDGTAIDYQSVVRQPDGKLVVAGNADSNGSLATDDIILRRYNSDGSIDTSFGVNGTFIWDSGGGWDYAFSVALQADGKIIVAGKSDTGPLNGMVLLRLNSDGTLDTGFNALGYAVFKPTANIPVARRVRVQPDGKITVGGWLWSASNMDGLLVRFNSDGTLDTSFNGSGYTLFNSPSNYHDSFKDFTLMPDGRIVVSGLSHNGTSFESLVARYNSDGTFDTSFNTTGYKIFNTSIDNHYGETLALQNDGSIYSAGAISGTNSGNRNIGYLAHILADGTLDTAFGTAGLAQYLYGATGNTNFTEITLQADGKIIVAGNRSPAAGNGDAVVMRFDAAGVLDASFGDGGVTALNIPGSGGGDITSILLQPDGKLIAIGNDYAAVNTNGFIIRQTLFNPVNGACGSSNGITLTSIPTANFCSAGAATSVTGSGHPWSWSCTGSNGGTDAACSATIQTHTVSFAAAANGTITGTASQGIDHGGSTTSVTATANSGYTFSNWTGTGGFATTTSNPLTLSNVTAAMTITANFTANPVNGACGSSNGITLTSIPTANFCSAGTATSVTGSGHPWSWSCTGLNGGTDDACSATIQTYTVSFTAAANGTITGTASQAIDHGGSTTSVTATANSGYTFSNWTGTGGFATTTSNPLTVSNVTAAMTITANFTANPVNGACGSSNGITLTSIPTANFCSAGTATSVTGSGHPWSWSCTGLNGGTDDACSATIQETKTDGILIPAPNKVEPTIEDALRSLKITVGEITPTADDIRHGDIAPIVNGIPQPDGKVNLGDTIVILRRTIGLTSW